MSLKSIPLQVWAALCAAAIGLIDVVIFEQIWSGCLLIAASIGLGVWALVRARQSKG